MHIYIYIYVYFNSFIFLHLALYAFQMQELIEDSSVVVLANREIIYLFERKTSN